MQKSEKTINKEPSAIHAAFTGGNPANLEIINNTKPAAKDGMMNG